MSYSSKDKDKDKTKPAFDHSLIDWPTGVTVNGKGSTCDFGFYSNDEELKQAHREAMPGAEEDFLGNFMYIRFAGNDAGKINDFNYRDVHVSADEIRAHQDTLRVYYAEKLFQPNFEKGVAACEDGDIPGYLQSLIAQRTTAKRSVEFYHLVRNMLISQQVMEMCLSNEIECDPEETIPKCQALIAEAQQRISTLSTDERALFMTFDYENPQDFKPPFPALNRLKFATLVSKVYYVAGTELETEEGSNTGSLKPVRFKEECVLVSQPAINLNCRPDIPFHDSNLGYLAGYNKLDLIKYESIFLEMVRSEIYPFEDYGVTDIVLGMRGTNFFAGQYPKEAKAIYAKSVINTFIEFYGERLLTDADSVPQFYLVSPDDEELNAYQMALTCEEDALIFTEALNDIANGKDSQFSERLQEKLVVKNRTQSQTIVELKRQKDKNPDLSDRVIGFNQAADVVSVGGNGPFRGADRSSEECVASRALYMETQDPQKNPNYSNRDIYRPVPPRNMGLRLLMTVEDENYATIEELVENRVSRILPFGKEAEIFAHMSKKVDDNTPRTLKLSFANAEHAKFLGKELWMNFGIETRFQDKKIRNIKGEFSGSLHISDPIQIKKLGELLQLNEAGFAALKSTEKTAESLNAHYYPSNDDAKEHVILRNVLYLIHHASEFPGVLLNENFMMELLMGDRGGTIGFADDALAKAAKKALQNTIRPTDVSREMNVVQIKSHSSAMNFFRSSSKVRIEENELEELRAAWKTRTSLN